jgi:hypothetical protein
MDRRRQALPNRVQRDGIDIPDNDLQRDLANDYFRSVLRKDNQE